MCGDGAGVALRVGIDDDMSIETPTQETREVRPFAPFLARIDRLGLAPSPRAGRLVTTRAPLRLDVMGGFADATGGLTVSWPLGEALTIAVRSRDDQQVHVCDVPCDESSGAASSNWPLSTFYDAAGRLLPDLSADRLPGNLLWHRALAATIYVLLRGAHLPHMGGGASVCVGWPEASGCELEASASLQAAAALALARSLDVAIDPDVAAAVCLEAQRLAPGLVIGPAAPLTALSGQADTLLQVRAGPAPSTAAMRLPAGVAVLGISSGTRHPDAVRKCVDAHVAALMGLRIVRALAAILPKFTSDTSQLGRITVTDYVEQLRDRLPTRMKGKAFLERFGELDDARLPIDPDAWYKIRSRTEHHIYENARAHQFVERLSRAARTGERAALLEAGELMYASHWSFGQRCGLGGIESDKLVGLLRTRGANEGILGARTSGLGAGGTVCVLLTDTAQSRQAVREAIAAFRTQTGRSATVLEGSSDGALRLGGAVD